MSNKENANARTDSPSGAMLSLFSLLPEEWQEDIIRNALHKLVALNRFPDVERMLKTADSLGRTSEFRTEVAAFAIDVACRRKDHAAAIACWEELFGNGHASANVAADTLSRLVNYLLPEHPTLALRLWEEAVGPDLPFHARYVLATLGITLAETFQQLDQTSTARSICATTREFLANNGVHRHLALLEKKLAKQN